MNLFSTSIVRNYWERFPISLRLIVKARLWTAIGAGGVLYLTPIIFNSLGFSAEQIGSGITTAAFAGIATRFATGYLLDKNFGYEKTIRAACVTAILSDLVLFYSQNFSAYLCGEFFLGAAAGIYWPSAELAVPLNCNRQIKSSEGYSLARSADAIGVTFGVLLGTIGSHFDFTRIIYFINSLCMLYILNILFNKKGIFKIKKDLKIIDDIEIDNKNLGQKHDLRLINKLFPLFLITLFVTGVISLLQSILPLDLANGGLVRQPFTDQRVATLVTIKLILLAILQWPVGYILRDKNSPYKFRLCLISLLLGFVFLSISNLLNNGYFLIIIAFIPLTISLCIFLPSASDAIIKSSPTKYQGSAMALYSQCFGFSSLVVPLLAGKLIDNFDTALQLWLIVIFICLILIPISKNIK